MFNAVAFKLTVTEPGRLVYADVFDPQFCVKVDRAEAVDWRANFAYKVVHLDRGVEWRFGKDDLRPWVFMAFEVVSIILNQVRYRHSPRVAVGTGGPAMRSLVWRAYEGRANV